MNAHTHLATPPTHQTTLCTQQGYILLPVAFTLALLASMAYMMNIDTATNLSIDSAKIDITQAEFAAEAAMKAAIWQVHNNNCIKPGDTVNQTILGHEFDIRYTGSSPDINVSLVSTSGNERLSRSKVVTQHDQNNRLSAQIIADASNTPFGYIHGDKPSHNHSTEGHVQTNSKIGKLSNSLIKFDISSVPTHVQIKTAQLDLYVLSSAGSADTLLVNRITTDWKKDKATWLIKDIGEPWALAGGDFDRAIAGSFEVSAVGKISTDVAPLVQAWLNGKYDNYGIMLRSEPRTGSHKKKYNSPASPHINRRPILSLQYYCQCGKTCS